MQDAENIFFPYQSRWLADKSQVKVCEKSRRIGLTWAQAADDVLLAASSTGMDVLYISFNQDMTREYIDACGEWAKRFDAGVRGLGEEILKDGDEREIKAFRIDFAGGNKILALSSRPSNLRGKQGRVVIDEAAFVEDLGEILKAALALLMWGGQVVVISTHNGADNAFNELAQDVIAGRLPYSRHRITLDDALADGLYRRICRVTKQEWTPEAEAAWRENLIKTYGDGADEELFCIPNRGTGAYLTTALIESCMGENIPVFTWTAPADDFVDWPAPVAATHTKGWLAETVMPLLADLPKERAHFIGGDFGRTGDLSVFWPLGEQQDLTLATPFAVELRNCPYRTQQQILFALADNLPRFSGMALDARGNGSALAEFARQEYGPEQVEEVMISEAWYRETMPRVKAGLEDRTLLLPKDAGILSDLRSLRVVKGVARVPETRGRDKTGQRHGDAAVALAMAIHAREKLGSAEPWECQSVNLAGQIGGFDWSGY
jgi:phage FluMu gp28-like protein